MVSLSVASLFDGWGVINSLCLSCRKTVVQKREGGLQPAAQTGNQTGTARQTRRPGELKRTKTRTQRNKTRGHWDGERAERCPNLDCGPKTWLYNSSKVILVWCFKTLEPELWKDVLVKSRTGPTVAVLFQERLDGISSNLSQVSIVTGGGTDEILVANSQRSEVSVTSQKHKFSRYKKVQKKKWPCKCLKW